MLQKVRHIYYRGFLESCNYHCSYCPFAKRQLSLEELRVDEAALNRFVEWLQHFKPLQPITVMVIPYGEALVHKHYYKAISAISLLPHVAGVSCQTNLSFNPEAFISSLKEDGADFSKINLWASYHKEMCSEERFASAVQYLQSHVAICAGTVGTPQMLNSIEKLRAMLPPSTYLWVNAMDGLKRPYTESEANTFCAVDPLFMAELQDPKADTRLCIAGKESIFVSANGNIQACIRSRRVMGNIYGNDAVITTAEGYCKARSCDCFLAYVHRTDMKVVGSFGAKRFFRMLKSPTVSSLFFDLDGTLTDTSGSISHEVQNAVERLSESYNIYLATARPYSSAMSKCSPIKHLLAGGVFANGADIRSFKHGYREVVEMQPVEIEYKKGLKVYQYTSKGKLFKIAIAGKQQAVEVLYRQVSESHPNHHVLLEDNVVSITQACANKLSGVLQLCAKLAINEDEVLAVGNSLNDIPLLSHFKHSVAVLSSPLEVKKYATYVFRCEQIADFLLT